MAAAQEALDSWQPANQEGCVRKVRAEEILRFESTGIEDLSELEAAVAMLPAGRVRAGSNAITAIEVARRRLARKKPVLGLLREARAALGPLSFDDLPPRLRPIRPLREVLKFWIAWWALISAAGWIMIAVDVGIGGILMIAALVCPPVLRLWLMRGPRLVSRVRRRGSL
jgi:hypothetical protein